MDLNIGAALWFAAGACGQCIIHDPAARTSDQEQAAAGLPDLSDPHKAASSALAASVPASQQHWVLEADQEQAGPGLTDRSGHHKAASSVPAASVPASQPHLVLEADRDQAGSGLADHSGHHKAAETSSVLAASVPASQQPQGLDSDQEQAQEQAGPGLADPSGHDQAASSAPAASVSISQQPRALEGTWRCTTRAMLVGQGADEAFGGYGRYRTRFRLAVRPGRRTEATFGGSHLLLPELLYRCLSASAWCGLRRWLGD